MPEYGQGPLNAVSIETEVKIEAAPERVFDALVTDISSWWGPAHTFSQEARDVVLEPRLGGRFYEDWGEGEGVLYATVTRIKRPVELGFTGPLGMRGAVVGRVMITLERQGTTTVVRLSHRVVGDVTEENRQSYSGGWQKLLGQGLKPYVERGERTGVTR
ncbi:MAG TPA: SRPBCC domain-containing protein [bacterium]|nr:SRPBCC domain-containing protein [bacterium]